MRDPWWDKAERLLIGLLGLAAMLVGLVQVAGRYIAPRYAISWAEEVIVYLIVWGIMLAASQLVRTDGHVRPDLLLRAVPPRAQRWMEVTNCIAALLFCAGLAWYGWSIVETSWQLDERSSSNAFLKASWVSLSLDESICAPPRSIAAAISRVSRPIVTRSSNGSLTD